MLILKSRNRHDRCKVHEPSVIHWWLMKTMSRRDFWGSNCVKDNVTIKVYIHTTRTLWISNVFQLKRVGIINSARVSQGYISKFNTLLEGNIPNFNTINIENKLRRPKWKLIKKGESVTSRTICHHDYNCPVYIVLVEVTWNERPYYKI